jgi:predicted membrane-bound dolichyl-phosphate-mannose-protein mannosyltransferase
MLHVNAAISIPEPIFDEQYYVPAARAIILGNSPEITGHPPLGQIFISLGMLICGDNHTGWRIMPLMFGTASIVLFYLVCLRLNLPRGAGFLAVFLFSIESMGFYLGSLAMLDVFSVTFMLAAFWAYLRQLNTLSGVFIALATLSKLSGALGIVVIMLHWAITNRACVHQMLAIGATSAISFLALLPVFDLAVWRHGVNPLVHIQEMINTTRGVTFAEYALHPSGIEPTRPWDWLIHLNGTAALDVDSVSAKWYVKYYLLINPASWALIIPAMVLAFIQAVKQKPEYIFAACWFAGAYLIWIPISLITDRLSYDYYFYPAVGAVCIGAALLIRTLATINYKRPSVKKSFQYMTSIYLFVAIVFFIGLCPGNIWLKSVCGMSLYTLARYSLDRAGWYASAESQPAA